MSQTFPFQPLRRKSTVCLALISAACLALAVLIWQWRGAHPEIMAVAAFPTLCLAALFAWFAIAPSASAATLDGENLILRFPLYGRTISLNRIVADSVIEVSAANGAPYRLTWRTNGLSVPGYNLGWFQTANSGKALVAATGDDVVAFKTKDDFAVLLSVADKHGFMRAIKQALVRQA